MSLTLKVEGGTPNHSKPSLCNNCKNSHITQGERTSDITIWCQAMFEKPVQIMTKIVTCNSYAAIKDQSLSEMQKIGYILETRKGKPIGFVSRSEHLSNTRNDDADVDKHDDDY